MVGTLFKAMPLQPSILREVSEEVRPAGSCGPPLEHFPGDTNGATCLGPRDSGLGCLPVGVGGYTVISLMLPESLGGLWPQDYLPSPNSSTTCFLSRLGANTSTQMMS